MWVSETQENLSIASENILLQPQPHRKRAKEYIKSNVETFELADTAK
jgi:hypothetical protein